MLPFSTFIYIVFLNRLYSITFASTTWSMASVLTSYTYAIILQFLATHAVLSIFL